MILQILNHFRLTIQLLKDRRVNIWFKIGLVALPAIYAAIPLAIEIPDFIPVIGLLDDLALIGIGTLIFNAVSPSAVVQEHLRILKGNSRLSGINLEIYRHPDELRNLGIGLLISMAALLASGMGVGLVWLILLASGYFFTNLGRARLLANAVQCSSTQLPELHRALLYSQTGLPDTKVNLFVTQDPVMNAYTFGYHEPYTIVLTSGLVSKFTSQEVQAVLGHELGHIHFKHVALINLMAMSVTGIEQLIFFQWSRSCEYTADAVALHASGNDPRPMISALLKLASGLENLSVDLDDFLEQVQKGDASNVSGKAEILSTHPFINNRTRRLIELASKRNNKGYQNLLLIPSEIKA